MNIWENAVVTAKGISLLSKLIEGDTLEITKAETGEGYVAPGSLSQMTMVSNPKQTLTFRTQSYPEEGKCKLPCYLTNDKLSTGYTAMQVGVYAKDPDEGEILFLIVQSQSGKGTVIPSEIEMPGYSAEWNLYFQYGQASSVSVTVDPTGAVNHAELEKELAFFVKLDAYNAHNQAIEESLEEVETNSVKTDLSNVDDEAFSAKVKEHAGPGVPVVYGQRIEDGLLYLAEVEQIEELTDGTMIIFIPDNINLGSPSLRINDFETIPIWRTSTYGTEALNEIPAGFLKRGIPVLLIYSASSMVWKLDSPDVDYDGISGAPPKYSYGTEDLVPGETTLATGKLHFVYE